MSDNTRDHRTLIALFIAVFGLGAAVFGIVRGLSETGPGHGVRLHVSIAPPLDAAAVAMANHAVTARLDNQGDDTRVLDAGDRLVVELGYDDPELVDAAARLIERRAALEIRAGSDDSVLLPGAIQSTEVASGGVAIELRAPARFAEGAALTFVLDGKVITTATADHVRGTDVHVLTAGATEDAAIGAALQLVAVLEAGAAHALHVDGRDPFTRATGFWPRAWPFFAAGALLVLVAVVIARRR